MPKSNFVFSILFLASTSIAHAQTTGTPKVPGDQGPAGVNKNLEKNPDNKGLQNASERLKANREKHQEQMKKREERRELRAERRDAKSERQSSASRPDKPGRPGK